MSNTLTITINRRALEAAWTILELSRTYHPVPEAVVTVAGGDAMVVVDNDETRVGIAAAAIGEGSGAGLVHIRALLEQYKDSALASVDVPNTGARIASWQRDGDDDDVAVLDNGAMLARVFAALQEEIPGSDHYTTVETGNGIVRMVCYGARHNVCFWVEQKTR